MMSWCDLPDDLVGDVQQLLPAMGDRVRFGSVCRAWRAAERSRPRPPVPWLVAPGHCVSLHDASIHRVALTLDGTACRGSFDNWLAMVPTSPPPHQPLLLNPFTMATVKLPMWTGPGTITKVVLSSSPDPSGGGCTVAVIARQHCDQFEARRGKIAVCRLLQHPKDDPEDDATGWGDITSEFYLQDMVFLEGKLYAVTEAEEIFAFDDADLEHYLRLPSNGWRWTQNDQAAPAWGRTEFYLVACHAMGKVLLVSRDFGVNRVPGTGSLAAAHHHSSRFKVYVVEEHEELEFTRRNKRKTRLTRVRRLDGHALFIGDASCQAIDVTPAGAGCRIKENQICYVDDERNMVVTVAGDGDGGHDWSSLITSCWALRSVQSYDLRTSCFRRYQRPHHHKPPSASPWECVMVQRFLGNKAMIPPPVTELGATLLLWQVISSMGGVAEPSYINELAAADAMVTVRFNVIHGGCLSFTAVGASAQEARQMVAWEAVTFLRTRYRSVLDDTPWDSIPHYHSHVNEIEYDEDFDDDDYD